MNPPPLDDDPRDAHLLAALRHAPDRSLLPPTHVTAAILGCAQQALRAPRAYQPAWRAALERLWQPAPIGAFGALAMATLIGVMWHGREPPDATPGLRPASVAAVPAASSASSGVAAASPRPAVADAPPSVAPKPRTAAPAKPEGPPLAKSTLVLPPAAPLIAPEPAATEMRQDAAALRRLAKEAVAEATAPAAAAPAPHDVLSKGFVNAAPTPARARSEAAALGTAAAPTLPASFLAPLSDARAAEPLAAIDAALAVGVRWQASGVAGDRSHGDAQRAFCASVRAATQGRWQSVPPITPVVPWLLVGRGSSDAVIWVMDGALHVTMDGRTWRAPVESAQVREWQEVIARW